MKGKKHRKIRNSDSPKNNLTYKSTEALLKIKFEISNDNISCFINSNRISRRKTRNASRSSSKPRSQSLKVRKQSTKKYPETIKHSGTKNEQISTDIIQQSSNLIISKIQQRGLLYAWKDADDNPCRQYQELQLQDNLSIWSDFTVFNDQSAKSYASTNDYQYYCYVNPDWKQIQATSQKISENLTSNTNINGNYSIVPQMLQNDWRTTLMVRNIPNKYSISQLAQEIDSEHDNVYDFLYLPCDIKNQCNVGYGFINFINTSQMLSFYTKFHNYSWKKYRSEKICYLAYARLQGLNQLIEHFANSKVLNQKDKKYRPIIKYDQVHNLVKQQQGRQIVFS